MKKETKTIRLIYPQWQGANIVKLITEVENPNDASRGYFLSTTLKFSGPGQWSRNTNSSNFD